MEEFHLYLNEKAILQIALKLFRLFHLNAYMVLTICTNEPIRLNSYKVLYYSGNI